MEKTRREFLELGAAVAVVGDPIEPPKAELLTIYDLHETLSILLANGVDPATEVVRYIEGSPLQPAILRKVFFGELIDVNPFQSPVHYIQMGEGKRRVFAIG